MKPKLEGSFGTGLQQISTQAVMLPTPIINDKGQLDTMPWSYAYYELAERHPMATAAKENREAYEDY